MTKRIAAVLVLLTVFAVPAHADFDDLARALSSKQGVKRIWIPFLGVARFAIWIASPAGVHDFQLATFEGADDLDAGELRAMIARHVGKGFHPLVQVWSRKSNEWSFIYAKPGRRANRMELIVLAKDGDDTTLIQVDIDAAVIARELSDPRRTATRVAARTAER